LKSLPDSVSGSTYGAEEAAAEDTVEEETAEETAGEEELLEEEVVEEGEGEEEVLEEEVVEEEIEEELEEELAEDEEITEEELAESLDEGFETAAGGDTDLGGDTPPPPPPPSGDDGGDDGDDVDLFGGTDDDDDAAAAEAQRLATADAPELTVGPISGDEDQEGGIPLNISVASTDEVGNETLSITISDLPDGATLSAGNDNGDGSWTLTEGELDGLSLITAQDYYGDSVLSVTATSTVDGEGGASASTTGSIAVSVADVEEPVPSAGTDGNDVLVGTSGDDEISGLGGDDVIMGLDGDDVLYGQGVGEGGETPVFVDNNTIATAQVIARSDFGVAYSSDVGDASLPRVSIEALHDNRSDVDFYAFTLEAGERLTLDIDYARNQGDSFDSMLWFYDSEGNQLTMDDDTSTSYGGGGSVHSYGSYIEYTVPTAGIYYAAVTGYYQNPFGGGESYYDGGDYVLNVSIDPTTDSTGFGDAPQTIIGNDLGYVPGDDDVLVGGGGDDTLFGGEGTDTAVFSGIFADYTLAIDGLTGNVTVIDNIAGRDGTDILSDIELLEFDDRIVMLEDATFNYLTVDDTRTNISNLTVLDDMTVEGQGDVTNALSGTVYVDGDFTLDDDAVATNYGTVTVDDDLWLYDDASVTNYGAVTVYDDIALYDNASFDNYGTVTVEYDDLALEDNASFTNYGTVTVEYDDLQTRDNASFENYGTVDIQDEYLEVWGSSSFTNYGTGTVDVDEDLEVYDDASFVNYGQINVDDELQVESWGEGGGDSPSFQNYGTIDVDNDLDVGGWSDTSATFTNYVAGTIDVADELNVWGSGSFDNLGTLTIGGDLDLDYDASFTNAGTLTIGDDLELSNDASFTNTVTVTVGDNVSLGEDTVYNATIGESSTSLVVGGDMVMGGALNISLADGSEVNFGGQYNVLSWGGVGSGFFDSIGGLLDTDDGALFDPIFSTDGLTVTALDVTDSNVFVGTDESDVLFGGIDDDFLFGGGGRDIFTFDADAGDDVVVDFGIDDALVFEGFSGDDVVVAFNAETHETVIGATNEGGDSVEVTLRAQEGSGYSVSEDVDGNTVVTLDVPLIN
jgi:hypothetical protein